MSGRRTITLVAVREIRERLRSKAFIASTLLIVALLAVTAVIGRLFDPQQTFDYAVTAPAPAGLATALQGAAEPFDEAKVKLRTVDSAAAGRRLLENGEVDALLLLSTDRLVFRKNVDVQAAAVADTAVRAVRNELPPEPELTTSTLDPPEDEPGDAALLVAYAGSLLLFMSLAFYGQWVISGVVEEKNNRVVEVILSAVRPRHLLDRRSARVSRRGTR